MTVFTTQRRQNLAHLRKQRSSFGFLVLHVRCRAGVIIRLSPDPGKPGEPEVLCEAGTFNNNDDNLPNAQEKDDKCDVSVRHWIPRSKITPQLRRKTYV